jgi:hypothetical protein
MILANGKHSSLLIHGVNNEDKKCFYNFAAKSQYLKKICQLDGLKKLECLSRKSFFRLV